MIPLVLFGAGGHSKVLMDIAEKDNSFNIIGLFDDNAPLGRTVFGYPVLGGRSELEKLIVEKSNVQIAVAVGKNAARMEILEWVRACGGTVSTLVHPSAQIGRSVNIGYGTVIMAGVVVNSDTSIGNGVILNTRSSIDHDCVVGDGVHVGPGVSVCGGVSIGSQSFLGVGAQVTPGVKIGNDVTVGAGSTVIRDVANGITVVGTPARKLK